MENHSSPYDLSYVKNVKSDTFADEIVQDDITVKNVEPETSHKVSSINVMLILGALLIIISGFIFATTTWATLGSLVKAVMILSFSAVLFAVSSLAERKLKLPKTGRIFYILGCAFLPITVFAVAFFKIFGEWFSFGGEGSASVIAVASLLTVVVCFKGSYDYKSKYFAFATLTSVSAYVISIALQIFENTDYVFLSSAVYSFVVILISHMIQQKNVKCEPFLVVIEVLPKFELINTIFVSLVSLIIICNGKSFIFTIACGIFATAIFTVEVLILGLFKRNEMSGKLLLVAFSFLISVLVLSIVKFFEASYFYTISSVVILLISAVYVSVDIIFNKKEKNFILRSIFTDIIYSVFALGILASQIFSGDSITITVICTCLILLSGVLSPKNKWEKIFFIPLSMLIFALVPDGGIFSENFSTIWVFTTVSAFLALITVMFSKRSKATANATLVGFTIVAAIYISISYAVSYEPIWQIWLILGAVYLAKTIFEKHKYFAFASIILVSPICL